MKAAKNFRAATTMLRQLQFAVTDLTLHSSFDPAGPLSIHDTFRTVAQRYQAHTPAAMLTRKRAGRYRQGGQIYRRSQRRRPMQQHMTGAAAHDWCSST